MRYCTETDWLVGYREPFFPSSRAVAYVRISISALRDLIRVDARTDCAPTAIVGQYLARDLTNRFACPSCGHSGETNRRFARAVQNALGKTLTALQAGLT